MDSNNAERWLTADEVAEHLGYSVRTIYDKVQRNEIPHQRIGRTLRFRRGEVDAWVLGTAEKVA
jgi:excisionase family DNA binding protein